MLRRLRWRQAKKQFTKYVQRQPGLPTWRLVRHHAQFEQFPPNARPYEYTGPLWQQYSPPEPRYAELVAAAGEYYRVPIGDVLDLACGTGVFTRQLVSVAHSVVGLDVSEHMLRVARSQPHPKIRYEQGDFRNFELGTQFDAVICGRDSLNYVRDTRELTDVCRCVCAHLRPSGLFVFDVVNHLQMLSTARLKMMTEPPGEMEIYYFYDSFTHVAENRGVMGGMVERHRRIPIERRDVQRAARATGLEVVDRFYPRRFWILDLFGLHLDRCYYVLRRRW